VGACDTVIFHLIDFTLATDLYYKVFVLSLVNNAKNILTALEGIDQDTTQSHSGQRPLLRKNDRLRENWIAQVIKENDRNLLRILKPEKLEEKIEHVCGIYARMVMGYEHDKDLKHLLEELKDLGVIEASTCG
jgi:hypothetical protein